ncbi:endoplasmic reticulum-Golgi intermediate compartment protein 2 isoform X1 [Pezoporus wallicus]|uniref:endoplasmic reticulum-Golgi intermediate compartment protein 2 n=1 Tax=Pezoporus occidentalis TaxID=407982 RepID=UPI00254DF48C|nr:endoplasmic reticulum-Golgi intermediate compartment protein 2 isoform X1 [Pezoporus wallicus]XP_061323431.1 endoplasmic reticulum-Golgi intermediate compartment protein 2 isoform X1 [Pezoporus flaviventris]
MRRLNRKKTLNLVKELDAFPKVPESYVETSASGGTVSLIAFTTIAFLTVMEFMVYRDTWMKYEYEVDKDFTSKLRINIDITVAMRCQYVGADVLDLAETMVASADGLIYEPVVFDLTPQQKEWQRMLQLIQSRLQEEHSLQDVIFKSAFKSASTALPPREDNSLQSPDACRIHGHLYVNKVAGNFHITVGKAIPHPRGHAHLAALVSHESYNFSHRIDHLSFGELIPGIINPLDGTEKIASDHNQMFQYFITVVPTKLHTHKISAETHQFSVTERERVINHAAGSHGVSGIFMKYDISSLMVTVTEEHMPFWQFLVRLCGIIGGIFSTTGILHGFGRFVVEVIFCRFRLGSYKSTSVPLPDGHTSNHLPLITDNNMH